MRSQGTIVTVASSPKRLTCHATSVRDSSSQTSAIYLFCLHQPQELIIPLPQPSVPQLAFKKESDFLKQSPGLCAQAIAYKTVNPTLQISHDRRSRDPMLVFFLAYSISAACSMRPMFYVDSRWLVNITSLSLLLFVTAKHLYI